MDSRPDADIIADVLAGDVEAYALLIRRYCDEHTRYAVRMLGHGDADEALQSAFLRAFRSLSQCHTPSRFGAWLHQIVVNECRTLATRRGRRDQRFVSDETILERTLTTHPAEEDAIREEIQYALNQLDVDQREAFILKHVEGLSYEEMAAVTGVGISALKMRVMRACERLRGLLDGVHHG